MASFMAGLTETLVPICIVVVLPVLVVWLVLRSRSHAMDKKTEIAIKAIESGERLDIDFFGKAAKPKSIKEKVFNNLKLACILSGLGLALIIVGIVIQPIINDGVMGFYIPGSCFLLLGLAFFVIYFIARRQFAVEIRGEEKKAEDLV